MEDLVASNGRELRLGEGAAKEELDMQFSTLNQGKGPVPDKWANADVQRMICSHNCIQVAQVTFDEPFQSIWELSLRVSEHCVRERPTRSHTALLPLC